MWLAMQHDTRRIVICNTAECKAYIALLSMRETQYDQIAIILVVRDYSEIFRCKAGARDFTHRSHLRSLCGEK